MEKGTGMKSILLVIGLGVVLVLAGLAVQSAPSDAVAERATPPTSTTTTEPPPEGVMVVRISNGSFRPSNVKLDLDEVWIVKWVNEDPREYLLAGKEDEFEVTLGEGDEFEFDYGTLEPGIYRVTATVGFQRIPGTIDTRPDQ